MVKRHVSQRTDSQTAARKIYGDTGSGRVAREVSSDTFENSVTFSSPKLRSAYRCVHLLQEVSKTPGKPDLGPNRFSGPPTA